MLRPELKKLSVSSSNKELKFDDFGQSDKFKNTNFLADLPIQYDHEFQIHHIVNTMQRQFVYRGGKCFPNNKLLKSSYLREYSKLLLDNNSNVYQAITDHYGNYTELKLVPHRNLLPLFRYLYTVNKEFFIFTRTYPQVLKIYKEYYDEYST